jgi:hypothetical protein
MLGILQVSRILWIDARLGALEPAREFVEDSLPVALRRTGMPRGELRPRAWASAHMCVRRRERP